MKKTQITVLIATRNRVKELQTTLEKSAFLLHNKEVEFIICDDNSSDGTSQYISQNYPEIKLLKNKSQKGIFYCRNLMFNHVKTKYAITIDDDINFIYPFEIIDVVNYFEANSECAVMAFRIFWGVDLPSSLDCDELPIKVKSFGAGAHAIKMEDWNTIPKLPEWFIFYGEEDFISIQLFKKRKEVHYTPNFFVQHRVNLKNRKKDKDYQIRLRRSLRSGWYLYILFYPWALIPKRFLYTVWVQFKNKVFKGDFKAFVAIIQAMGDVVINMPRLLKNTNRLSKKEFLEYSKLPEAKLYWSPKKS